MAYQGRTLPVEEWARLDGTDLGLAWRRLSPESTQVLVVEDETGAIVACWSILTVAHAEGLWIRPDHRQHTAVARALWTTMQTAGAALGLQGVFTAADDPAVDRLLVRHGAVPLPARHYALRFDARARRRDLARGRHFHDHLFAQMPDASHADDDDHDRAVGAALRVALDQHDPAAAERAYNAWAATHDYVSIRFLGTRVDGALIVDIVDAVLAVTPDGLVTVLERRTLAGVA